MLAGWSCRDLLIKIATYCCHHQNAFAPGLDENGSSNRITLPNCLVDKLKQQGTPTTWADGNSLRSSNRKQFRTPYSFGILNKIQVWLIWPIIKPHLWQGPRLNHEETNILMAHHKRLKQAHSRSGHRIVQSNCRLNFQQVQNQTLLILQIFC